MKTRPRSVEETRKILRLHESMTLDDAAATARLEEELRAWLASLPSPRDAALLPDGETRERLRRLGYEP